MACAMLTAVCGLGGCTTLPTDTPGERWAFGFVRQTVSPPDSGGNRMVAVTTIGLGLATGGGDGSGASLGYNRSVLLKLGKDACVDINTTGLCRQRMAAAEFDPGGTP
jgi:hypothetical protein